MVGSLAPRPYPEALQKLFKNHLINTNLDVVERDLLNNKRHLYQSGHLNSKGFKSFVLGTLKEDQTEFLLSQLCHCHFRTSRELDEIGLVELRFKNLRLGSLRRLFHFKIFAF